MMKKKIYCKFYPCFTRFFIRNAFKINRQKMIYWFINLNFDLMFSSSVRGWRKKVKINKQWAFILHLKNSSFLIISWKVKKKWGVVNSKHVWQITKWILMLKTEHKNLKIYSLCKNDGMINVFFLFIYHQEECTGREKMLISCVSYSRQIPVLVFLIFATNFSTVSYRAVSYKKTCSLNLVCFIGECYGSARYLLHQLWEKWSLHIKDPRRENICTKAVFVVATERCIGNVE